MRWLAVVAGFVCVACAPRQAAIPPTPEAVPSEASPVPWDPPDPQAVDCTLMGGCAEADGVWIAPARAEYLSRWIAVSRAAHGLAWGELARRDEQWAAVVEAYDAEMMAREAAMPDFGGLPWWGWALAGAAGGAGVVLGVYAGAGL